MDATETEKLTHDLDALVITYSPVWRRFVAMLIDGLATLVPAILLSFIIPYVGSILVVLLYEPLFLSSAAQATPGKRAMGIRVESISGGRIGYGNALARTLLASLSELLLMLGHFCAFFTEKRQALHDILAETVVVEGNIDVPLVKAWVDALKSFWKR